MKKIFLLTFFLMLICLFSYCSCINAAENDFDYKGFSFKYGNDGSSVYPVLVISCDYPEDIPHKNYPYSWNPSYYTLRDSCLLDLPDSDLFITGSFVPFYSFEFNFDEISPEKGMYKVEIIQDGSKILFQKNFTLKDSFSAEVASAQWKYKTSSSSWSYKESIGKGDVSSIIGMNLIVNISNVGDIPFSVGGNYLKNLPILYKFDIYKDGFVDPVFSQNLSSLKRTYNLVEGNNNENTYFKPNETIEYSEDFSTKKDSRYITFVVGDYSIKGEVHIGEHIIEFSRDKILSITDEIEVVDSSPGFEIALFIIAVSFGLMLFRKKNK